MAPAEPYTALGRSSAQAVRSSAQVVYGEASARPDIRAELHVRDAHAKDVGSDSGFLVLGRTLEHRRQGWRTEFCLHSSVFWGICWRLGGGRRGGKGGEGGRREEEKRKEEEEQEEERKRKRIKRRILLHI